MGGTFLELLWTLNTGCSLAGGKHCDDYRDFHGSSGCLGTLFRRGYPKGKSNDSLKEPQNPALEAAVKMASHAPVCLTLGLRKPAVPSLALPLSLAEGWTNSTKTKELTSVSLYPFRKDFHCVFVDFWTRKEENSNNAAPAGVSQQFLTV